MISLADFDPAVVAGYEITRHKLEQVHRYVRLIQGPEAPIWRDIAVGSFFGTSALLHEVVELEILLARDPRLLQRSRSEVLEFFFANEDAHAQALLAEHRYLQQVIAKLFGQHIPLGALLLANASNWDFEVLLESDLQKPLFAPGPQQVTEARTWLSRLRALGKEMPK